MAEDEGPEGPPVEGPPQEPVVPEGPPVEGPPQEPVVEEVPDSVFDSWWRSYSKFAAERIYSRDEFFDEVASQFRGVPFNERKSRAGQGPPRIPKAPSPVLALPVTPLNMNVPDISDIFMEKLEQGLMAKFLPESRESTMYRTMREAERKEGMKQDFKVRPMSKEDFLRDLQNQISSVQWKEKRSVHKATISRPGIRKKYQVDLKNESF